MLKYFLISVVFTYINSIAACQDDHMARVEPVKVDYLDPAIRNLYVSLSRNMKFPEQARRMKMEGIALFQFELTRNGKVKSTTSKNQLANTFMWMFNEAIAKVSNDLFLPLIKMTQDSAFTLPVKFSLGNSSNNPNEKVSDANLKPIVVRAIGWQRRRIITAHGDIVEPGTEGTYYDLNEAAKSKSQIFGLSLVRKDLSEFPKQIQGMQTIKYIDFEGNFLHDVPDFVGELNELEEVYLYKNKIETTPASLSKLTKLRNLVISNNNLSSFPDISNLKNLELLDLSNNKINEIPPEIIRLTKLRFLYLDNNDIKSIPIELLYELPNLERLYLQGNPLTEKDITSLTSRLKKIEFVW